MRALISVLFFAAIVGSYAQAAVWSPTEQWSDAKELQYQTWIQSFMQVDSFSRRQNADGSPNPYYGLTTDCADTVYAMRIIFAYENSLPWAIRDPRDRSQLITQDLSRFDHLTANGGRRIRAFINYINGIVSTKSIANDTYPISINRIVPGTIILTSHKNHHSWTIAEMMSNGNPRLVFNSVVGKESGPRLQQRISWPNPYWIFEPEERPVDRRNPDLGVTRVPVYVPGSYAGLRYWIPVDQLLNDPKLLPGYSEDQYALDLSRWKQELTSRLARVSETVQDIVHRLLLDACEDIRQRIDSVKDAENYKAQLQLALTDANTNDLRQLLAEYNSAVNKPADNRCLIYARYDQFSTPSRDRRLLDAIMLARTYFKFGLRTQSESSFSAQRLAQFKKIFSDPLNSAKAESASESEAIAIDQSSICINRIGSEQLDLAEVKRRLFKSHLSPNPNEDMLGRWGGRGAELSEVARTCTTYGDSYPAYDIDRSEKEAQDEVDVYSQR